MKDDTPCTQLGGIILAGGASKRMGKDKAGLQWQGTTILKCLCNSLNALSPLVVVGPFHRQMIPLQAGIRVEFDAKPYAGPLAGLAHGLESFPASSHVFVTGCDYPGMNMLVATQLHQELEQADAVVLTHRGYRQPLPGVYRASILPCLQQLLHRSETSLQALLNAIETKLVPESVWQTWPDITSQLTHFNTWEEYEAALSLTSAAASSSQPDHPVQLTGEQPHPQ
ncbi:MAG: molybdenum cofactor guanylyltransferase [Gemmatales bacterium]